MLRTLRENFLIVGAVSFVWAARKEIVATKNLGHERLLKCRNSRQGAMACQS